MEIHRRILGKIENSYARRKVSKKCILSRDSKIAQVECEGHNRIRRGYVCNSYLGCYTYISEDARIYSAQIGRFCCLGPNVRTLNGKHPSSKFVSIHPSFFSMQKIIGSTFVNQQKFEEIKHLQDKYTIIIGNDVWIGGNVSICDGVSIGDGAIIAAGAVVTNDVPPYAIVGGIPAKIIRYRFDEATINYLDELKWWNKEESWIQNYAGYFHDIDALKTAIQEDQGVRKYE